MTTKPKHAKGRMTESKGTRFMNDFVEVANRLKPIWMRLSHSTRNLGSYMHALWKLHLGPTHRRREGHPHKAHYIDEKYIKLYIPIIQYTDTIILNHYLLPGRTLSRAL